MWDQERRGQSYSSSNINVLWMGKYKCEQSSFVGVVHSGSDMSVIFLRRTGVSEYSVHASFKNVFYDGQKNQISEELITVAY